MDLTDPKNRGITRDIAETSGLDRDILMKYIKQTEKDGGDFSKVMEVAQEAQAQRDEDLASLNYDQLDAETRANLNMEKKLGFMVGFLSDIRLAVANSTVILRTIGIAVASIYAAMAIAALKRGAAGAAGAMTTTGRTAGAFAKGLQTGGIGSALVGAGVQASMKSVIVANVTAIPVALTVENMNVLGFTLTKWLAPLAGQMTAAGGQMQLAGTQMNTAGYQMSAGGVLMKTSGVENVAAATAQNVAATAQNVAATGQGVAAGGQAASAGVQATAATTQMFASMKNMLGGGLIVGALGLIGYGLYSWLKEDEETKKAREKREKKEREENARTARLYEQEISMSREEQAAYAQMNQGKLPTGRMAGISSIKPPMAGDFKFDMSRVVRADYRDSLEIVGSRSGGTMDNNMKEMISLLRKLVQKDTVIELDGKKVSRGVVKQINSTYGN